MPPNPLDQRDLSSSSPVSGPTMTLRSSSNGHLHSMSDKSAAEIVQDQTTKPFKVEYVWRNIILMLLLHILGPIGIVMGFLVVKWATFFFGVLLLFLAGFGVTAGAHRLWTHRCYKAKLPLRIALMICNTMAFQNHVYEWSRDHRVHHKFSETDADPHNAKRGFFFSHVGWLLCRKHPDVRTKGKQIDLSDLLEDPVVVFQKKYYIPLLLLIWFAIPTYVPTLWGESAWNAFMTCCIGRYVFGLNCTWMVNSFAHMYGSKPYDRNISAVDQARVAAWTLGEGWHNYHHSFPWDYRTSELGIYDHNWSTALIDLMAYLGQAYDLKTADPDMIMRKVMRTGDGSTTLMHPKSVEEECQRSKLD